MASGAAREAFTHKAAPFLAYLAGEDQFDPIAPPVDALGNAAVDHFLQEGRVAGEHHLVEVCTQRWIAAPKGEGGTRFVEAKFNALAAAVGVARSYRGKVLSFESADESAAKRGNSARRNTASSRTQFFGFRPKSG